MQRRDGPAIRDTIIWFALLAVSGGAAYCVYALWGWWWALPVFAVYGVLYASPADSRWHECGHGTAFKTPWMNAVVYNIASFLELREATPWRWSHVRHHSDTIIVGRDREIAVTRPPSLLHVCLMFVALNTGLEELGHIVLHCFGRLTKNDKELIPESEFPSVFWTARVYAAIFATVIAWSIAIGSVLPAMFIGLPTWYGSWLLVYFGLPQHAGLAEDVLDHRLNCRTVYYNPIFRFICWNMNYHVEHHMFPLVPYHALPALHEAVKSDMPPPYPSLFAAYREIIPALLRQIKDPTYFVKRPLPPSSQPSPETVLATAETLQGGRA